jgi:hypothetical protein
VSISSPQSYLLLTAVAAVLVAVSGCQAAAPATTGNSPHPGQPTDAALPAGTGATGACTLVTEQDASMALGRASGPGKQDTRLVASQCNYDDGALIVTAVPQGKAGYDASRGCLDRHLTSDQRRRGTDSRRRVPPDRRADHRNRRHPAPDRSPPPPLLRVMSVLAKPVAPAFARQAQAAFIMNTASHSLLPHLGAAALGQLLQDPSHQRATESGHLHRPVVRTSHPRQSAHLLGARTQAKSFSPVDDRRGRLRNPAPHHEPQPIHDGSALPRGITARTNSGAFAFGSSP